MPAKKKTTTKNRPDPVAELRERVDWIEKELRKCERDDWPGRCSSMVIDDLQHCACSWKSWMRSREKRADRIIKTTLYLIAGSLIAGLGVWIGYGIFACQ